MAGSGSKNLSIMMTDIQGYSDISSAASREDILRLIDTHNRLMIPVIEFYGGVIVKKIGDAFLAVFDSATDAVVCAIMIQLILKEYNESQQEEVLRLSLRVVINSGDVSVAENDIFGTAVNITARMEGLPCFPGGTIGISESTYLLLNRNEIVAEDLGEFELKGIPFKVRVYKVPLEKQNLVSIPAKLLKLAQKASRKGGTFSQIGEEWKSSIDDFLEKNDFKEQFSGFTSDFAKRSEQLKEIFREKTGRFSGNLSGDDISDNLDRMNDHLQKNLKKGYSFFKDRIRK